MRLEQVLEIGVASGDPRYEFGDIAGIAVDPRNGVVVVFDGLNLRLSAFTARGAFMDAAGRPGSGPREFLSASAPVVLGTSVYLSDVRNGRISYWELGEDGFTHRGGHRVDALATDKVCGTTEHIFMLRYSNGGLVQKVDPASWAIESFGDPLVDAPGLDPAFVVGPIACDATEEAVYVVSFHSGVRRYDGSAGSLVWETPIPGVEPPHVEVDEPTGLPRFSRPDGQPWISLVSLVPVGRGQLWLQVAETPRTAESMRPGYSGTDIVDVETIVYDAATGAVLERRADLPRVDYAAEGRLYSRVSDPVPQVRIYRWR